MYDEDFENDLYDEEEEDETTWTRTANLFVDARNAS